MRNGDRHNVSQGAVMDIKGEHFHGKEHKEGGGGEGVISYSGVAYSGMSSPSVSVIVSDKKA